MNIYKRKIETNDELRNLALIEYGALVLFVDHYYFTEAPIDHADRYLIVNASSPEERVATDVALGAYFELRDGRWHKDEIDAEIKAARSPNGKN